MEEATMTIGRAAYSRQAFKGCRGVIGVEQPAHFEFALSHSIPEKIDEFVIIPNLQNGPPVLPPIEGLTTNSNFDWDSLPLVNCLAHGSIPFQTALLYLVRRSHLNGWATARHQGHQKEDEKDNEENLGNFGRQTRHANESQQTGQERNN
jgi:hypothetical protein